MDTIKSINLIRAKTMLSPQMELLTQLLQKVSLWALVALAGTGIVVGGTFYVLRARLNQVISTETQLSQVISQDVAKEGILITLKHQVTLTNSVLKSQKNIAKFLETLGTIVPASQLMGVSLADDNTVVLRIRATSIAQVISIIDALVKQSEGTAVRSPQLVSFSVGDAGIIDVVLLFRMVL